ncbi:Cross-pathway control protein A [Penicillium chermesinum]|nr:Cross-pathway control protein A [Penicillium chermesinum]
MASHAPPPQPSAPSLNNNSNSNNNSALEDFVLYPAPQARPQPRPRDSRAQAPSGTALRPSALQPFLAQNHPRRHSFSLQLQRHLQQQFPGSPVQDPRVTKLARSPSYWSHSTHSPQRPPVPPFFAGSFTEKQKQQYKQYMAYRRNMSTPNLQAALGNETDGAYSPGAPTGTISPKDLMFETSVPPSGTFTDLSTPPFDSPGTFSQNPSPLFTDVDFMGQDDWAPLFHDGSAPNVFDVDTPFDVPALPEPKKEASLEPTLSLATAPRRVASKASPIPATGNTKHSSVSGVSRQRKDLSPIEFDPTDPVAAKRARNTEAARKSRAKKLERQANAEGRIRELEELLAQRDELIANLQAQLEVQRSLQ